MARDFEKNSPSVPKADLENIVQSTQAKKLLQYLQQDGGEALRRAAEAASAGDYDKVRQLLAQKLKTKEAESILKELGNKNG